MITWFGLKRKAKNWKICFIVNDVHIIIMFKYYYHFTANPALPDCLIPVGCPGGNRPCTENGSIDMGDCNGPPKRCRQRNIKL
jgi:hypothetical protein